MSTWSRRIASRFALLRQLRRPGDFALALRIFAFAAVTPFLMRLPLERVSRIVTPRIGCHPPEPGQIEQLLALIPAVLQAGRPLLRTHCLPRGLTHYFFLRRAGLEVELCFGMGSPQGDYAGHCWLELNGAPYLEARDPGPLYAEFFRFPSGAASHPQVSTAAHPTGAAFDR